MPHGSPAAAAYRDHSHRHHHRGHAHHRAHHLHARDEDDIGGVSERDNLLARGNAAAAAAGGMASSAHSAVRSHETQSLQLTSLHDEEHEDELLLDEDKTPPHKVVTTQSDHSKIPSVDRITERFVLCSFTRLICSPSFSASSPAAALPPSARPLWRASVASSSTRRTGWSRRRSASRAGAGRRRRRRWHFPPNVVSNTKYNVVTFVPHFLYEQFSFFFNFYYLLVSLSQFIPALQVSSTAMT